MGGMGQFDRGFPGHGFPNQMGQHPAFMGAVPPGSQPMNPNFSYPVKTHGKNTEIIFQRENLIKRDKPTGGNTNRVFNRGFRFNAPNPVRNVNPNFGDPNQGARNGLKTFNFCPLKNKRLE